MKLLYKGCHGILEYDELKIFSQISGIELFSTGMYFNPKQISDARPPLDFPVDKNNYKIWDFNKGKWNDSKFLDQFDVLYFMHCPFDIFDNVDILRNRKIVWRTIGQSSPELELKMQLLRKEKIDLKVVRYSPRERIHKNYAGEDALIRFGKDPSEYCNWNGNSKKVISVVQSMKSRGPFCGWDTFYKISEILPCQLFGHNNKDAGNLWNGKNLNYKEIIDVYKNHRVYFYAGTKPASYCLNFIEAWMTGIPVVAVGPQLGNGSELLYEIQDLITCGENGYWSDSPDTLIDICKNLIENDKLAKCISESGRKKAIELFDESKTKQEWEEFFKTL